MEHKETIVPLLIGEGAVDDFPIAHQVDADPTGRLHSVRLEYHATQLGVSQFDDGRDDVVGFRQAKCLPPYCQAGLVPDGERVIAIRQIGKTKGAGARRAGGENGVLRPDQGDDQLCQRTAALPLDNPANAAGRAQGWI